MGLSRDVAWMSTSWFIILKSMVAFFSDSEYAVVPGLSLPSYL